MPQIPRETIDQLRNQVDIADVISQDIQLKKQGKNLMGHCPFHEDATPSFSVNEEKQYFYCFSCHRSGDVFSYLEQAHDLSFMEAVEQVATTAGVDLPRESNGPSGESASPNTPLYRLHEEASRLYHHVLVNTVAGQPALNYLTKRGLSRELIDQFNLGFAPARGEEDLLVKYFTQKGIDYQLMRASGLFTEDQTGQLHDRFFDRVIYPIKNANGQPIAFSGRLLAKKATENAPKYLNSPETPIFNKRRTLFNLDQAKKAARKEGHLTLFEGFMDVISAFGAGVRSGIASMGTSFTDEQVAVIARTTDKLTICYDGDAAGQNAINRALTMLAASRLTLR
ncbi:MAG: DNA primase, partial [Limosilactobacillus fermentum]|nr:DNA primase [Limosilactobacillus fermentum]